MIYNIKLIFIKCFMLSALMLSPIHSSQGEADPCFDCITPLGFPCTSTCHPDCGDWYFDFDFLYWDAAEMGLTYGSKNAQLVSDLGTVAYENKIKNPHHNSDLGLRLGFGHHVVCECYDVVIFWTNYSTDAHARRNNLTDVRTWFTPAFGAITPLLGTTAAGFPVNELHAHWKLRMNLIDIEIGREYIVNTSLVVRPFIGGRVAIIDQRYDIAYTSFTTGEISSTIIDDIHNKSDFEGTGIRIGSDAEYNLGCGVSIFGELAGSLLYGESQIKMNEYYNVIDSTGISSNTLLTQKDWNWSCRMVTDASLGLQWQQICCEKIICMAFSWEQHYFFSENQFEKFSSFGGTDNANTDRYGQNKRGELCLQGFVLSARIEF